MPQVTKIFRVFISSTFTDMRQERGYLQREIFPKLEAYCEKKRAKFQAVDLRWGVSEDSQLNQKTMEVCLNELYRCQRLSPKPNFIVLLGDKYGWRPAPGKIPSTEMTGIKEHLDTGGNKLIEAWYKEDLNADPAEYVLLPREGKYADTNHWSKKEKEIVGVLKNGAEHSRFNKEQQEKYFCSATHQEINKGAFGSHEFPSEEHVFAYVRKTGGGLPERATSEEESRKIGEYVDFEGLARDSYAKDQIASLKEELRGKLGNHYREYLGEWNKTDKRIEVDQTELIKFGESVYNDLVNVIGPQLGDIPGHLTDSDELKLEREFHEKFKKKLIKGFEGREDVLRDVKSYLDSDSRRVFSLLGDSGTGKSSVMAKAVEEARAGTKNSFYRFIGISARSSNIQTLLKLLCNEIAQECGKTLVSLFEEQEAGNKNTKRDIGEYLATYDGITEAFQIALKQATEEKPVVVFLDALNQLSDTDQARDLDWLPRALPEHSKVIVSSLAEYEPKLRDTDIRRLPDMPRQDAKKILDNWLCDAKRKLQPVQEEAVLNGFQITKSPLYLKLSFEKAVKWHSCDAKTDTDSDKNRISLPDSVAGMIDEYFEGLESEHTKELVSRVMGYLLSGKHEGLTEKEILDMLVFDKTYWNIFLETCYKALQEEVKTAGKLPIVVWSRLFLDLEPYMAEMDVYGSTVIVFFHNIFIDNVRKRYIKTEEENRYFHGHLAEYFRQQPCFLDAANDENPNTRKTEEQPWQEIKAEEWDLVADTLSNLWFIESKVRAGLVYELNEDYDMALKSLPEARKEQEEENIKQGKLRKYTSELIEYSKRWNEFGRCSDLQKSNKKPDAVIPIIESMKIWTEEDIEKDNKRVMNNPTRLDKVKICRQFAESEKHNFLKGGTQKYFCIQQAHNYAKDGFLGDQVNYFMGTNKLKNPCLFLCTENQRKPFNYHPGLIKTFDHPRDVSGVSITPDGSKAVSGCLDNALKLWDLETGECLRTLSGHTEWVSCINITPEGSKAISGSGDNTLRLWDLETGQCLKTFRGHTDLVKSVSITPDGSKAVSGSNDGTIKVWDLENEESIKTLKGHTGQVNIVSITADGNKAVSGSGDNTLKVWNIKTGECIRSLAHYGTVTCAGIIPDGSKAISSCGDNNLKIWDLETGKCIKTLSGHTEWISCVGITPDGRKAVSGSSDNTLKVWDLETGGCLKTFKGHTNLIRSVSITPDGSKAVSGSNDRTLKFWDLETGKCIKTLEGHNDLVRSVSITANGEKAVSGSDDKTLKFWDLESGYCIKTLQGHTEWVNNVSITPDGKKAVSGSYDNSLKVWDIETGECLRTLEGHTSSVDIVRITPDNRKAVSVSTPITREGDKILRIWELDTGKCIKTLEGHTGALFDVILTPEGRKAVSGSYDNTLKVWDLETGECLRTLKGYVSSLHSISITPDGFKVVSGGWDNTLKVWDLETGECLKPLEGHTGSVWNVNIMPDGRKAVTGSYDNTLRVWDLETGECMKTLEGHTGCVVSVYVTHDGCKAVSGGNDKTLKVWDLNTWECLKTFYGDATFNKTAIHPRSCLAAASGNDVLIFPLDSIRILKPREVICTAKRLWLSNPVDTSKMGKWDEQITCDCKCCGERFSVPEIVINSIQEINRKNNIGPDDSPCSKLPAEAWNDLKLLSECPKCRGKIRFNPFIADNK